MAVILPSAAFAVRRTRWNESQDVVLGIGAQLLAARVRLPSILLLLLAGVALALILGGRVVLLVLRHAEPFGQAEVDRDVAVAQRHRPGSIVAGRVPDDVAPVE